MTAVIKQLRESKLELIDLEFQVMIEKIDTSLALLEFVKSKLDYQQNQVMTCSEIMNKYLNFLHFYVRKRFSKQIDLSLQIEKMGTVKNYKLPRRGGFCLRLEDALYQLGKQENPEYLYVKKIRRKEGIPFLNIAERNEI